MRQGNSIELLNYAHILFEASARMSLNTEHSFLFRGVCGFTKAAPSVGVNGDGFGVCNGVVGVVVRVVSVVVGAAAAANCIINKIHEIKVKAEANRERNHVTVKYLIISHFMLIDCGNIRHRATE